MDYTLRCIGEGNIFVPILIVDFVFPFFLAIFAYDTFLGYVFVALVLL